MHFFPEKSFFPPFNNFSERPGQVRPLPLPPLSPIILLRFPWRGPSAKGCWGKGGEGGGVSFVAQNYAAAMFALYHSLALSFFVFRFLFLLFFFFLSSLLFVFLSLLLIFFEFILQL